jgi:WhiB family transcriptional regulator, redox-sensing transcriptional regulator
MTVAVPAVVATWFEVARQAECAGADLDLFITPGDGDEPPYPSPEATTFCDRCPVRTECLAVGMYWDADGVWGGMTRYQRHQITRKRERPVCPACSSTYLVNENGCQLCLGCGTSWFTT